ncbi:hypothetical protein [Rubripirellula reticaptiva]|uniref:Uncharacterized protein n=1 Tax=Rubripirellula reticaptiva TaxID=2528013 RepID=A0A5C6EL88_9BACT|nr:hypothetical protein [Rubripirellula reticaptiva]TWU48351.1 hypothetical protein Poly59_51970 [Rubripirellula reticaptiva]
MNERNESRALLLEQLESRCMLAAGLISFSTGNTANDLVGADRDRPAMVDLHAANRMDEHDSRGRDSRHDNASLQHVGRSNLSASQFTPFRGDAPNRLQSNPAPLNRLRVASPQFNPLQNEPLPPVNSFSISLAKLSVDTIVVLTPSTANLSSLDLGRAAVSSSAQKAASRDIMTSVAAATIPSDVKAATGSQTVKTEDKLNPGAPAPGLVSNSQGVLIAPFAAEVAVAEVTSDLSTADQSSVQARPNAISPVEFDAVGFGLVELDSAGRDQTGGSIAAIPLLRHEFDRDQIASADEAWEVDSELLNDLREMARDSSRNNRIVEDPISIDVAITEWFGHSTGLIDDIQLGSDLPSIAHAGMPSMVDVVLDATLGMHRSVGLIAKAEPELLPNNVRDAILAAIAAQQPAQIESVAKSVESRVAGMAYPGIVIVASTLAVASRRQKIAKLESSR